MAVTQPITKKFTPNVKEVNYLVKNFSEFRQNLIDFTKSYYPSTYTDFNEASPGMMFIEMAAYVGDVLSFYIDNSFRENLLSVATERKNVIAIAQSMGYRPKLAAPASVTATLFIVVPALTSTDNYDPNSKFFLKILANSRFSSNVSPIQTFKSINDVDFNDPTERILQVFARNGSGVPTAYLVGKPIKLIAADTKSAQFTFGPAQKFSKIALSDSNVISIVSVIDSDGNDWTEVEYLGQDVILDERDITPRGSNGYIENNPLTTNSPPPAKLAIYKKKPRRFTTRINSDLKLEIWFGSGTGDINEEIIQLNSTQVANSKSDQRIGNNALDPSDFLSSNTFGMAPANTTLTITYLVGGGVESNAASNTITKVDFVNVANEISDYDPAERNTFTQTVDSVAIYNDEPATGGGNIESVDEMRENALAFFNAQNRVVTDKDYVVRTLAMPPKFGSIAKAFVLRDEQMNAQQLQNQGLIPENTDANPYTNVSYVDNPIAPNSINLYLLGYDAQSKLTTVNTLIKQNLAKYLEQYRVLTDDVNILDAFIVNIGVDFDIIVYRGYNINDVLARTIDAVRQFFDIDKWQINQPIILNDLRLTIGSVEGVQTVNNVRITNKYKFRDGRDYQEYRYPIGNATVDDVVYPSLDPCIFEIKYPETDIVGNARQ